MADRVVKYVFQGDIKGLTASMSAAGASVNKFAGDLTKLDKDGAKMRQGLTAVGNAAGKVGLAAAAGLGAAIAVTANFDQAMSNVQAATHETAKNMDALREAAIRAGADTAFSASEAAAGIENLAKAGVATKDILGGGLQGALDLAAAGEMDVADAAETAATALTMFKLKGEDVPHVADLLAAAAGKAQGDVSDMAMALKQSGLVAAQTGLSIEETTGTLAAFASAGLVGSDAGTSFKTMLQSLTPTGEKAANEMERLGITAYDAQGNFVGMTEFAASLKNGLSDLSVEQQNAAMKTIFGSDAVRAASVVFSQGADGIQEWINKVDDSGYASETAAIRLDNLKGDLEAFKGSLETALIGIGEGSQGPLRGLVQGATDAVNAFNDLPPAAQSTVAALGGITAVVGGGLFLGSRVVQGIANTSEALGNLGIDATKATKAMKGLAVGGAVVAGLGAVATAIIAIRNAMDESLPGVETLTGLLLNVSETQLPSEFDSISESLRRLSGESQSAEEIFGDMLLPWDSGEVRRAKQEIDDLDQAFANIAQQGGPEKAMQVFRDFAAAQHLTVSEQRDLLDRMPLLGEAFASAGNDAKLAEDGIAGVGAEATDAAAEVYTLQNAMDLLFGKVDVDAALVSWKRGLNELKGAVKDNAKTLDVNTKAGQDNRDAIRGNVNELRSWAEGVYDQTGNLKGLETRLLRGRDAIIKQAEAAGFSKKETHAYLNELGLTPKEIRTAVKLMGTDAANADIKGVKGNLRDLDGTTASPTMKARDQASAAIAAVRNGLASLHDKTIMIRAIHTESRLNLPEANGGVVDYFANGSENHVAQIAPAGAWRVWAEPETGGEAYIPLAASKRERSTDIWRAVGDRLGVQFQEFANGGITSFADGGIARPDRSEILSLLVQIRDLRKELAKDGKDALHGLDRKQKQADLAETLRDLAEKRSEPRQARREALETKLSALQSSLQGFDVTGALPGDHGPRNPVTAGVRSEIREFRDSIKEAGGEWTKAMRHQSERMLKNAHAIDVHERALERETKRRDELAQTLADQQQAMEQLQSTMTAFSQSVAGNFTGSPFGQSRTETVAGTVDPALQSRLGGAEARLAALRSSPMGDSLAASAEASRLIPQIEAMRAEVEKQSQPIERTVSGLELMREQLAQNTKDALAFAEALKTLQAEGLNGDLFAQLAASGDVGTAQALAAGGMSAVEDINALWNDRAAAAAEVAAFATQTVYGQQQAILQAQIDNQNRLIQTADGNIKALNAEVKVLGNRVERGAEKGVASLRGELQDIRQAIASIPRQTAEQKRKAGK